MALFNSWITPLQRSYQSIKNKVLESLKTHVPEMTDTSEGNIFVIIISIFAAIAEVLHYYIDNTARESFLVSSRRMSSVYKHAKAVDYHMKAANPASVDLTIYKTDDLPISTNLLIPVNTVFVSNDGKQWVSSSSVNWRTGSYFITVPVEQKQPSISNIDLGQIIDQNMTIELGNIPNGKLYAEGSMLLSIQGTQWKLVDTFAYSGPTDRVYKVELNETLQPIIIFGDGKFGMLPTVGQTVRVSYYLTEGRRGNISAEVFNTMPSFIRNVVNNSEVTNTVPATGGTDYEDFESLKKHIPLSIKTLGVAITKDDWESLVRLVPGVDKSYINYICGRFVEIYITPVDGAEASGALLNNVKTILSKSKVITTSITVKSTKPSYIVLHATITGRKSFSKNDIENQVRKTLISNYNSNKAEINQPVRLSDLYSLMDQQSTVDYLTIDKLFFLPLVYPIGVTAPPLRIANFEQVSFNAASNSINFERVTLEIVSSTKYRIYLFDGTESIHTFDQNETIRTIYTEFNINITKTGTTYVNGDRYILVIQKMDRDLIPYDYTLPVLTSQNLKLTINEKV